MGDEILASASTSSEALLGLVGEGQGGINWLYCVWISVIEWTPVLILMTIGEDVEVCWIL